MWERLGRRGHWIKRVCFVFACGVWLTGGGACIYAMFVHQSDAALFALFLLFPVGLAAVLGVLNLCAFPLPYSVLGERGRTPCPSAKAQLVLGRSWVQIGLLFHSSWPTVRWAVYEKGIAIRILLIGEVFLRKDEIISIEFDCQRQCVITHSSEEVRSPIKGPARLGKAVSGLWGEENGRPPILKR